MQMLIRILIELKVLREITSERLWLTGKFKN